MHETKPNQELVILIHGLMRSHTSMQRLAWYLRKKGYEVYIYNYPSTKYTIREHGEHLQVYIEKILLNNPNKNVNFITHSLGGIITREALNKFSDKQLRKCKNLIMLAPPNKGSLLAKICISTVPILSRFIKPLGELSCEKNSYVHQVGVPKNIRIGIIAGRFDAKTPPSVTQLSRQDDFLLINSPHTFIMNHPKARKAIVNFLQKGFFVKN